MIALSGRSYLRETGGNTRYIRTVVDALRDEEVSIEVMAPRKDQPLRWAGFDAFSLQRRAVREGASAAWYPVDTGPVVNKRGVLTVVTLHGVGALHEPSVRSKTASTVWLARAKRAAQVADVLITPSNSSRDDIGSLAGDTAMSRTLVIPHGVGNEWFSTEEAVAPETVCSALKPEARYVFFYGNIEPRKNLPLAIDAVERLRDEYEDLQFVVSGAAAWDSEHSFEMMARHDWVHYLGRLSDEQVRTMLFHASLFLFPSRYEGFGLPVLEALAVGAPVVCSDRGSLGEVAGDAAYLVADLDLDGVVAQCLEALRADREEIRARGRTHARSFAWTASVARHKELFDSF